MRRRLLLVVALLALMLGGAAGCSDCDFDCAPAPPELQFTGTLVAVNGQATTWDGPDGRVDIEITSNVGFLDVGERYRVSASRGAGSLVWQSAVNPGGCSCGGGNIRHEDGAAIDTGWWTGVNRNYPVTEAVWIFLAIPVVTIVAVTAMRLRRGGDYDPWGDLPDDGSWIEYDGYVDEDEDADEADV